MSVTVCSCPAHTHSCSSDSPSSSVCPAHTPAHLLFDSSTLTCPPPITSFFSTNQTSIYMDPSHTLMSTSYHQAGFWLNVTQNEAQYIIKSLLKLGFAAPHHWPGEGGCSSWSWLPGKRGMAVDLPCSVGRTQYTRSKAHWLLFPEGRSGTRGQSNLWSKAKGRSGYQGADKGQRNRQTDRITRMGWSKAGQNQEIRRGGNAGGSGMKLRWYCTGGAVSSCN